MKPEDELIHGIEEQTEQTLRTIREEVERLERDRKAAADREIAAARRESDERVESQRRRIDKTAKAAVATERHKIALEARERFFGQVSESVREQMQRLIGDNGYRKVLKRWIVEAAIGLAEDRAVVGCSAAERELCREVLPEAAKEAGRLIGRKVELVLSDTDERGGQGVVLTAASGRTAFNNQVRTRILRRETEIRRIIYDELSRVERDGESREPQQRESRPNNG